MLVISGGSREDDDEEEDEALFLWQLGSERMGQPSKCQIGWKTRRMLTGRSWSVLVLMLLLGFVIGSCVTIPNIKI